MDSGQRSLDVGVAGERSQLVGARDFLNRSIGEGGNVGRNSLLNRIQQGKKSLQMFVQELGPYSRRRISNQ